MMKFNHLVINSVTLAVDTNIRSTHRCNHVNVIVTIVNHRCDMRILSPMLDYHQHLPNTQRDRSVHSQLHSVHVSERMVELLVSRILTSTRTRVLGVQEKPRN